MAKSTAHRSGSHMAVVQGPAPPPQGVAPTPAPLAPPVPLLLDQDLTSWRVSAGVRAERIMQDIGALSQPDGTRARDARACVEQAAGIIARSQRSSWPSRALRSLRGSDIEHAWQLLKQAEENVALAKSAEELKDDVPWLCDVARLSYSGARADQLCETLNGWVAGKSEPDAKLAADILAADHSQTDAAHEQTRALRNLLYIMALVVLAFDVLVWRFGVDYASVEILILGALGGALAMVFAVTKGSPVTPYNLALPQLLLKIVSGSAIAVCALIILDATLSTKVQLGVKDLPMYAIVFGFSQQLFTQLVDNRAAALKTAIAPKAKKAKDRG